MFLQRGPDRGGGLEHSGVELLGPFFERAQRLLESLPRRLPLELPQALLNRGLAAPLLLLGVQFSAVALLHDPQLLLDDALLSLLPTLLKVLFGFDRFELLALLGGLPLFGQHLASQLHDADPVAE